MATVCQLSNTYLECGCNSRTIQPPSNYFNTHLHNQLSNATDLQVNRLYDVYQTQIQRFILSQFIDHLSIQSLTFEQENSYYATFNDIIKKPSSNSDASPTPSEYIQNDNLIVDRINDKFIDKISDKMNEKRNDDVINILPTDCWTRIFQFIDQKSKLLKICFVNDSFYRMIRLQSSWNELTIHCHRLYYYDLNFFKFKQFLMKSGRLIQSLTLFDILTNERDWTLFIQNIVTFCPKICNIRIKSMSNQSILHFKPHIYKLSNFNILVYILVHFCKKLKRFYNNYN